MESEEQETLIITQQEAGLRLDKILASRYASIKSRAYFQYLIESHCVLVNNEPVKKRHLLQIGDELQVQFIVTPEIGLIPEAIPLNIIYEDEDILIINKPAGMVVHPAVGNWTGTFVNALLYHCKELLTNDDDRSVRPGIVHRLDKDTTGLLIAAKNQRAQQRLIEMFAKRQVLKEYVAICHGNPGVREIVAPIGRHPIHRKLMAVVDSGKSAVTHCQTIKSNERLSLVKLVLETGRTHQIRVHLKHIGCPIVGDPTYGPANNNTDAKRQMLHARLLNFKHPIKDFMVHVEAPFPADMEKWIKKI